MKLEITGNAQEIAALVAALQERRDRGKCDLAEEVRKPYQKRFVRVLMDGHQL